MAPTRFISVLIIITHTFEDIERPLDLLKSLLVGALFEWSRIWGFMQCIFFFLDKLCNVFPFQLSYNLLVFVTDLFVIVSSTVVFIIVNTAYFFIQ